MFILKKELISKYNLVKAYLLKGFSLEQKIYENILIKDGYMYAGNGTTYIKQKLDYYDESNPFILSPANIKVINGLPSGAVLEFKADIENNMVILESSSRNEKRIIKNTFKAMDVGLFDTDKFMPSEKIKAEFTIDAKELVKALEKTSAVRAKESVKEVFEGIHINKNSLDNHIEFVGSDTFRILVYDVPCSNVDFDIRETFNYEAAEYICKVCLKGEIKISLSENKIYFKTENFEIITNLYDTAFFDYKNFFDRTIGSCRYSDVISVKIEKELMEEALAFIAKNVTKDNKTYKPAVIFNFDKDALKLDARLVDGSDYSEEIEIEQLGEKTDLKVGYNPKLFSELIKTFDEEKVLFNVLGSRSPLIIKPDEMFGKQRALILPVILKE